MENKTEVAGLGTEKAYGQHFQSIFCAGVKIRKIRTDSDISVCSVNWLIDEYILEFGETPDILLVNSKELSDAKQIVPMLGYELRIISVPLFKTDSWAIAGSKGVFWSPGA
jgi:hypothetical protein